MYPLLAFCVMKILFNGLWLNSTSLYADTNDSWNKILIYSGAIVGLAVISFTASYLYKAIYGTISENMTKRIWKELFASIIYKHIGWFDKKENSTGALTDTLTNDV